MKELVKKRSTDEYGITRFKEHLATITALVCIGQREMQIADAADIAQQIIEEADRRVDLEIEKTAQEIIANADKIGQPCPRCSHRQCPNCEVLPSNQKDEGIVLCCYCKAASEAMRGKL